MSNSLLYLFVFLTLFEGGRMRRWIILGTVVLLVFSSFVLLKGICSRGFFKKDRIEKCESCSCQDFNIGKALSEVNARIKI